MFLWVFSPLLFPFVQTLSGSSFTGYGWGSMEEGLLLFCSVFSFPLSSFPTAPGLACGLAHTVLVLTGSEDSYTFKGVAGESLLHYEVFL